MSSAEIYLLADSF